MCLLNIFIVAVARFEDRLMELGEGFLILVENIYPLALLTFLSIELRQH